jgi:hypothetical protein
MSVAAIDRRAVFRALLLVAFAFFTYMASRPLAQAETHTFVISKNEGYGILDCLGGEKACGQIVADAYCEAQGFAAPVAFGTAEDVTGKSGGTAPAFHAEPGAFIVTCTE